MLIVYLCDSVVVGMWLLFLLMCLMVIFDFVVVGFDEIILLCLVNYSLFVCVVFYLGVLGYEVVVMCLVVFEVCEWIVWWLMMV